jgi:bacterioferritin-associated ferredoxin
MSLAHEGPLADADAAGAAGSMTSGPGVRIALRLRGDVVEEARFETCAFDAARPVAEALCAALAGTSPADASRWTVLDVAQFAGIAPKTPAARIVHFAKSSALQDLFARGVRRRPDVTCTCFHVAQSTIVAAVRTHRVRSIEEIKAHLPVTTGCGSCRPEVQRIIDVHSAG